MGSISPFLIGCSSLLCIAYTFVAFTFLNNFLTLKVPNWFYYTSVIIFSGTIPTLCILYLSYPVLFITLYLFMIAMIFIATKGDFLIKLYSACFFVFQLLVIKGAIYGIYALINNQPLFVAASDKEAHFVVTIIAFVIAIGIMAYYIYWQKIHPTLKLTHKQLAFMTIVINVLYLIMILDTFSYHILIDSNIFTLYHIMLYILLFAMFLIIYTTTVKSDQYRQQTSVLEDQLEKQLTHYNTQADYIQNYRTLTEVYSSQIRGLNYISETNDLKTIQDYIRKLDINSSVPSSIETFSNNLLVDAILQDAFVECSKLNAEFSANITIPEELKLTDFDIAAIFSHLVNNAVQALKKIKPEDEVKKMFIKINTENNVDWITYTFENSYLSKNKHVTTGIQEIVSSGLKQTEFFINKYDGMIVVEPRMDVYCVTVTFPLTQATSVNN